MRSYERREAARSSDRRSADRKADRPKTAKAKNMSPAPSPGVGFSDSCKSFDGMSSSARMEGLDKKFDGLKTLHPYHPQVGKVAQF